VLEGSVGVVESPIEHLADVHHRHAGAPSVLEELGVVDGAMMVHHERGPLVVAEHDVRWIAEEPAVEVAGRGVRTAHDRLRSVVVAWR